MKTKILIFIGVVSLVTLSFTFSNKQSNNKDAQKITTTRGSEQLVGFISDEVVK